MSIARTVVRVIRHPLALIVWAALMGAAGALSARRQPAPTAPAVLPPAMSRPAAVAVPDSLRGYPVVIGAATRLDGSPARHAPLELYARDTLLIIGTLYVPGVGWVRDSVRVTSAPAPALPVPDRRPRG